MMLNSDLQVLQERYVEIISKFKLYQGYNKTINKFPEYKPDPLKVIVRHKEKEAGEKKENFK